ncbi:hypothetical protein Pelo_14090 [Pelomyxa schiedti]|nr:hypothetical protein Pelo_14090 [Pelomyxa schiedti]
MYAKDQFVTLAWGAIVGARRPISRGDGVNERHRSCFLSVIPIGMLVEFIGKRWIMRKERDINVTFSPQGGAGAADEGDEWGMLPELPSNYGECDKLQFVVSCTLGVITCSVDRMLIDLEPKSFGGKIGGGNEVRCTVTNSAGDYRIHVLHPRDRSLLIGSAHDAPLMCWNGTWIVVGQHDEKKLYVWSSVLSRGPPVKVIDLPLLETAVSMRFFGPTEYDCHSDDVEIIFTQRKPNNQLYVCVTHLNIRSVVDPAGIPPSSFLESAALPDGIDTRNLSRPLVNRQERSYFFPFSLGTEQRLLHLRTGNAFTWLPDSRGLTVAPVDDTHIAVTDDSSATTVFSLSDLSRSGTQQQHLALKPTCVHPHSIGTTQVTVGCGLVVFNSIAPEGPPAQISTVGGRIGGSQHDFVDASTGSLLLTVKFPNGLLMIPAFPSMNTSKKNPVSLKQASKMSGDTEETEVVSAVYAKDQFVTLAWGAIMGYRPLSRSDSEICASPTDDATDHGGDERHRSCFLSIIPIGMLVELIGKRWIMRKERDINVTFSPQSGPGGVDDGDDEVSGLGDCDRLHFAVSCTLGVIECKVDHIVLGPGRKSFGGKIGGGNEVRCTLKPSSGYYRVHVLYPRDMALLQGSARVAPLMCWNGTWIVVLRTVRDEKKLHVWRSESPSVEFAGVIDLPLQGSAVSMRFFGPTEYDCHSDDVEIILSQTKPTNQEHVCVTHLNIRSAVDHADPPYLSFLEGAALPEGFDTRNLSQPLVNRQERSYFFPFSLGTEQRLLHLHTGNVITWLAGSQGLTVATVDDTHIATTSEATTFVFSLSDLLCGCGQQTHPAQPISVHPHPIGTAQVTVGCGLVTTSSFAQVGRIGTASSRHGFVDASTGSLLLSLKFPNRKTMITGAISPDVL